jgi:hypothetical protein
VTALHLLALDALSAHCNGTAKEWSLAWTDCEPHVATMCAKHPSETQGDLESFCPPFHQIPTVRRGAFMGKTSSAGMQAIAASNHCLQLGSSRRVTRRLCEIPNKFCLSWLTDNCPSTGDVQFHLKEFLQEKTGDRISRTNLLSYLRARYMHAMVAVFTDAFEQGQLNGEQHAAVLGVVFKCLDHPERELDDFSGLKRLVHVSPWTRAVIRVLCFLGRAIPIFQDWSDKVPLHDNLF